MLSFAESCPVTALFGLRCVPCIRCIRCGVSLHRTQYGTLNLHSSPKHCTPALRVSHPLVTREYYCRLGDFPFIFVCVCIYCFAVFCVCLFWVFFISHLLLVGVGLISFTSFECPTRCRHQDASWRSRLYQHRQHAMVVHSSVTRLCCWRSVSEFPVMICTFELVFMSSRTITIVIQLEKGGVVNIFSGCQ